MESLIEEDEYMTLKRIDRFKREEEEKMNKGDLKKAEKLFNEEKKW
jgi:hypothetical protein